MKNRVGIRKKDVIKLKKENRKIKGKTGRENLAADSRPVVLFVCLKYFLEISNFHLVVFRLSKCSCLAQFEGLKATE